MIFIFATGMDSKEKYRELCRTEKSIPLFSRDWWLDVVCGENNWGVLLAENNGVIEAAMPLYTPVSGVVTMPPYAQTMGVWFNPVIKREKYYRELLRKQEICAVFIDKLSEYRSFHQCFHHTFTDWLPFYWKGYRQTTRYTYLLPQINDRELLWKCINQNQKRNIEKARIKYNLVVKKGIPVEEFLEIHTKTYHRQGKKPYHQKIIERLVEEVRRRSQGEIWGAYDEQGRLHGVNFFVWQNDYSYCLASGGDPGMRGSGAHSLIIWEALPDLSTVSEALDFEGSMVKNIEYFNKGFGSIQTPYFSISKGKLTFLDRALIKWKRRG